MIPDGESAHAWVEGERRGGLSCWLEVASVRAADFVAGARGHVSGYDIVCTFGAGSFYVVVSTQVLEHVARPAEFVAQIAQVLKPNGQFWCSLDSGHFSVSHAGDKLWKRAARPVVSRLFERFHDFGLTEDQVRRLIEATDMRVEELLHCNLGPVKPMASNFDDTRIVDFMPLWCRFEEELAAVVEPSAFRDIYVRAVRNPEPKG